MNKLDWSKEQRQAPIGLILFSIETMRKLVRLLWPILIGVFVGRGNSEHKNPINEQIYFYGAIAIVVFVLINSFLSYWFFRFQIVEDELLIKKGYLKKVRLSIPLERIQTVNIKQNIVQKVLNLVSVEIDTAGANETEVKLIAVKRSVAELLREEVKQREKTSEINEGEDSSLNSNIEASETILELTVSDVVKVGISENHLRSFAAIMGVGYWAHSQIRDVSDLDMGDIVTESSQFLGATNISFYFWIFAFLFAFLVSVLFSFVWSFIRFYELNLRRQANSFKLSFGLISTKEITIPMSKIQVISWHQNPLRQLLRFETLKIKQATSGERLKKKQAIEIPACKLSHQQRIKNAIFGETEPVFSEEYKSHWIYFVRKFLFVSLAFILPTVFYWWQDTEYQIAVLGYEVFFAILFFIAYKRRGFRVSESQIEITKGHISKTIYQLQNYKIQSVRFRQNILIKKRGLADIIIYTASGEDLKIPYIPEKLAMHLYNFLLYKFDSSEKSWM